MSFSKKVNCACVRVGRLPLTAAPAAGAAGVAPGVVGLLFCNAAVSETGARGGGAGRGAKGELAESGLATGLGPMLLLPALLVPLGAAPSGGRGGVVGLWLMFLLFSGTLAGGGNPGQGALCLCRESLWQKCAPGAQA